MSGYLPTDADDELPAELIRVRNAVACELNAQLGLRDEELVLSDVCEVAHAVAVRLGCDFRIEPTSQDGLQDDDFLSLDGAAFHGSSLPAEDDPSSRDRYPIFDYRWPSLSGRSTPRE